MSRLNMLVATTLGAAALTASPVFAQQNASETKPTTLSISAQGSSTRTPDIATFSAGVTTQGTTASEALLANSKQMTKVISALKSAGVADRDIQTRDLSVNPVYAPQKRLPDGSYEDVPQRIIAYRANNTVSVRHRKLEGMGKVIDSLVSAGANEINGPNFALDAPEAAQDEARVAAIKTARSRADLYAKAAGLRVSRIISISESGSYAQRPMMVSASRAGKEMAYDAPVEAGELETNINVTVNFELIP